MHITVIAKKVTINSKGNRGTHICFAYHDNSFEGLPAGSIWVPERFARPENIIVGQRYKMSIHESYAVKLEPI
ncbi:MAG: hypothetical protein ACI3XA_02330 [Clostridia bacterium]